MYSVMADTLHDYKMRFAALLQRYAKSERLQHSAHVAKEVVGKEQAALYPMYLIHISEQWPNDPEVIAEMDRLDLIPKSKELILSELYALANDKYSEKKDRAAFYRLYCEVQGLTKAIKSSDTPNEFLVRLEQLHNASTNPVET